MKIELLVSDWCQSCHQAEKIWREVVEEKDVEFAVLDMSQPEGKALVSQLRLKTIPALVIDGELKGIGVQSLAEARSLVEAAPSKAKSDMQHAGISLSTDNRYFAIASMIYLMLSGMGLIINGALLSDGPARPVALHLFTVGFVLSLIYALGAHMLPRFTGNPIQMGKWPWAQMGLLHLGLLGYVAGYLVGLHVIIVAGGVFIWLSLFVFSLRIWPVLWPKASNNDSKIIDLVSQ
ncbi:thioredoxin family protein [Sulfurirhabdus autotrophica]|uniref:Thioredoxin-like protein n=1 Tax=Sulfurirhabdus autotrophica TaxID=1706046 RepID=A0A4R3YEX4_9PROT|nr:thioredoxin family protein [Sulfurirhabdus autotrophica]TCV90640.1 thioredoxin-like protein [Sulfurirhabdus autotrophica]